VKNHRLVKLGIFVGVYMAASALVSDAFAQGIFGGGPRVPSSGFLGWIFAQQSAFYKLLSDAVKESKGNGTAAFGLAWLSFLYGIFHAAGPGHGKAVISSYLVADDATMKRGILLSAAAALAQAVTAISLVGIAALLLGATARAMGETVRLLELVAYGGIALFGLMLAWRKGRAFFAALRSHRRAGRHHRNDYPHDHSRSHDHHHHLGHSHGDDGHDHSHGPEPSELKGKGWLKRGITAVVAVGLRPCSGAILVLVFALSQGIFWVGVTATLAMAVGTAITVAAIAMLSVWGKGLAVRIVKSKSGSAATAVLGIEFAAAILIIAFGALLFTGYMASERLLPA
jgi:nickel/cobalt exporter